MGSFLHLTFRLSANEGRTLADLKHLLGIEKSKELDHLRHQPGPSRLVACTESCAVVGVEVLVEEDVVAPVGVGLELLRAPVDGPPAMFIAQEDAGKPVRDLLGSPRRGSSSCLNRSGTRF